MKRWPAFVLATVLSSAAVAEDLVVPTIIDGATPASLTDVPGDPAEGERLVRDMTNASCLICHALPIADEPDPGNIGPPLDGVADRYTEGELRLRLVDPKSINPDTVMPAYYKVDGLYRVLDTYAGKTIYTAQQVEDVVAYLMTLHETP